jgi:SOS-response transcriptional repressor LexA
MKTTTVKPMVKKAPAVLDAATLRRKRALREYVSRHGGPAEVARAIAVEPSYISQLQSDGYPFGELAARRLERKLGLTHKELEGESVVEESMGAARPLSELGASAVFVETWDRVGTRASASAALEKIVVPLKGLGPRAFVLRMPNDSMLDVTARPGEPSILPGMLVCADPDQEVKDNEIAIVRIPGAKEAVCRQIVEDMGFRYLRALNRQYSDMPKLPAGATIIGKVVGGVASW